MKSGHQAQCDRLGGPDGALQAACIAPQVLEVGVLGQGQGHDGLLSSCPRALVGPKGGRTACCRAPGRLSPFPRTGGALDATVSVRRRPRAWKHAAYARRDWARRTIHEVVLVGALETSAA